MTGSSGGDGYRADVPAIRTHSAQVGRLADRVDTAHSAAETAMSSNAFGVFGQFLALQVVAQCDITKAAVRAGGESLHNIKKALDETAADYEATDSDNKHLFEGFNRGN